MTKVSIIVKCFLHDYRHEKWSRSNFLMAKGRIYLSYRSTNEFSYTWLPRTTYALRIDIAPINVHLSQYQHSLHRTHTRSGAAKFGKYFNTVSSIWIITRQGIRRGRFKALKDSFDITRRYCFDPSVYELERSTITKNLFNLVLKKLSYFRVIANKDDHFKCRPLFSQGRKIKKVD